MLAGIPPKLIKEVEHDIEFNGVLQPLAEYVQNIIDEHPTRYENIKAGHPDWTDEQINADSVANLLNGYKMLCVGFSKRIAKEDPGELAAAASLYARLEFWSGTRDEYDDYSFNSTPLLYAAAAGDIAVCERYFETGERRCPKGAYESRHVYNAIAAITLRDTDLLAQAIADFDAWKKPKKFWVCMFEAFRAMLNLDADAFAAGLEATIQASTKLKPLWELFKAISLESHGVYELARWYDPELVAKVDTERKLPWDREFYAWVREHQGKPPFPDVSENSPLLQQWLEKLPFKDGRGYVWP